MSRLTRLNTAPPLPLDIYTRRPSRELPFPLNERNCRIFSLARRGLYEGVKALGLEPGDEILVPAYHHGSEIEALIQAGIVCRFYDIGRRLEPNEEELEALLGPRVRALHLTHFLGLPQNAAFWRAWCDERGLLLIEDAAQAWLASRDGVPVGSHGDLAIFCLYKSFGLPDGAAVISDFPPCAPPRPSPPGVVEVAREHAIYLEQQWGWLAALHRRFKRVRKYDPERDFALGDSDLAPSMASKSLIPRVADQSAQSARAANYAFLLQRLRSFVPEPFLCLREGASPFAFPIRAKSKTEMIARLYQHGIVASNFWSVPHFSLKASDYPQATDLRRHLVGLPVHQEVGSKDLERVANAVLSGS